MALSDLVFVAAHIVGTKLIGTARSVVSTLALLGGTERADEEPLFTAPIVFRPDPERSKDNATPTQRQGVAETWAVRTGDNVVPGPIRDLRLNAEVNGPEGSWQAAHYGGGFLDMRWNADKSGTVVTFYVPRKDGSGTAVAAHSFALDSAESTSSIVIQHASGATIALDKDGNIMFASGSTLLQVKPDGIVINGNVNVTGAIVQGASDPGSPAVDFVALATKTIQELQELRTWALAHGHPAFGAPASPTAPPLSAVVAAIGSVQTKAA